MVVLDANILIRAVLGRRVLELLEESPAVACAFSPDVAHADCKRHLSILLKKKGKSDAGLAATLEYLEQLAEPVDSESYCAFEDEARRRLRGRDEDDWPVLAAALALSCAIWTEDMDFFGTGVPVWTTNRIEIFLKAQRSRCLWTTNDIGLRGSFMRRPALRHESDADESKPAPLLLAIPILCAPKSEKPM